MIRQKDALDTPESILSFPVKLYNWVWTSSRHNQWDSKSIIDISHTGTSYGWSANIKVVAQR